MLRLAVLLLLLANGLYFAWAHNLLAGWGPTPATEPQRLQQQVKPELLQLLPRANPASAPASSAPAADAGGLQHVAHRGAVTRAS
ncbi:hypothetical protein RD110_26425 [Rhodoferax koreense]|uniref:Sporulation protein n=2 Tax=Rhodoferax koreensis TaxID=1842727 RepID=A0A1P8K2R0_9BURK|nr:hypothetical protein RD110_26425 [Rhodoferax koreense]